MNEIRTPCIPRSQDSGVGAGSKSVKRVTLACKMSMYRTSQEIEKQWPYPTSKFCSSLFAIGLNLESSKALEMLLLAFPRSSSTILSLLRLHRHPGGSRSQGIALKPIFKLLWFKRADTTPQVLLPVSHRCIPGYKQRPILLLHNRSPADCE